MDQEQNLYEIYVYNIVSTMASNSETNQVDQGIISEYWHADEWVMDDSSVEEMWEFEVSQERFEEVEQWKELWRKHPLNRCDKEIEQHVDRCYVGDYKFDWERFVTLKDLVWKWACRSKKMVSKPKPKKVQMIFITVKSGERLRIVKPFSTVYPDEATAEWENKELTRNFSLLNYKKETDFRFTYGNYEAALKITEPVWRPRLKNKKGSGSANWKYVIMPICFDFLSELQTELNGYNVKFMEEFNSLKKVKPMIPTTRSTPLRRKFDLHKLHVARQDFVTEKLEEVVMMDFTYTTTPAEMIGKKILNEYEEEYQPNAEVNEGIELPEAVVECVVDVHRDGEVVFAGTVEDLSPPEGEVNVHFESESDSEYEQKAVPKQYRNKGPDSNIRQYHWSLLKMPEYDTSLNPQIKEAQSQWSDGSYFNGIVECMERIGRPDIAINMRSDVRIVWLRNKFRCHALRKVIDWKPASLNLMRRNTKKYLSRRWNAQSGQCVLTNKFRNKVLRVLTQNYNLLMKHRDKMEVLSHRGRFSYMTKWDMCLFEKQKHTIHMMDTLICAKFCGDWNLLHRAITIPRSYVEEVNEVLENVDVAIKAPLPQNLWDACMSCIVMRERWLDREFDVKDTVCFTVQGSETPLKASAPAGEAAKDTTAVPKEEKPISSGEKKVNLTMVDQRGSDSDKLAIKSNKDKTSQEEGIYQMLDIVKRPMLIDKFTWSSNDQRSKVMKNWLIPNVYFSAQEKSPVVCQNLNASYLLAMFGAASFDIKIRVQVNSVKFQQGLLVMYIKPFSDSQYDQGDCFHNVLQFPSVKIDASESNPVELTFPFTNFRSAFPIYSDPHNEYNYFGQVVIQVWNPLLTGASSSSDTTVSVWMWLENFKPYQLCNPKAPGKVVFATALRTFSDKDTVTTNLQKPITFMQKAAEIQPQALEMLLGEGMDALGVGAQGLMEDMLRRVVRGEKSKPGNPAPPMPVCPQVMPNSAWGEGRDLSNRLSLSPLEITRPAKTEPKITNLKDLIKEWSRIRVVSWSVNDEENKQLSRWPMSPNMYATEGAYTQNEYMEYVMLHKDDCGFDGSRGGSCTEVVRQPTMLEYLAKAFYYWHGSLKVRLEVIATAMHSGRLLVRYEPFGTNESASLECQKMATPGIVWDVQENHVLDIELPYMSTQPFLLTQYPLDDIAVSGLYTAICGIVEIVVMNRLKVTTGISDSVEINVYLAAGDDFEFAVPSPLHYIHHTRKYGTFKSIAGGTDSHSTAKDAFDVIFEVMQSFLGDKANDWTESHVVGGERWLIPAYSTLPLEDITYGPYASVSKSKEVLDYATFVKQLHDAWVKVATEANKLVAFGVPNFKTHHQAYLWLNMFPNDVWPTDYQKYAENEDASGRPDNVDLKSPAARSRLLWWMAYFLCKQHAWSVRSRPKDVFMAPVVMKAQVQWMAQGKEVPKNFVNPFKGFAPKVKACKEIMGEEFMDMYKIMKRPEMWTTLECPPSWDSTNNVDFAVGPVRDELNDVLATADDWTRSQYYWEFRIPVTPYLYYHTIGAPHHVFCSQKNADTMRRIAYQTYCFNIGQGEIGSRASLTHTRYFAELFSFWKGSMRYRLTFPKCQVAEEPGMMYIAYHPRTFTPWEDMYNNYDLVHIKRLRDMSKLGMQLYQGNVMGSIEVEVPYYSMYEKLELSAKIDETTSSGTLLLYVPVKGISQSKCKRGDFSVADFPVHIWQSVGDDFEFSVARAAPQITFYQPYVTDGIVNNPWDRGYDQAQNHRATLSNAGISSVGTIAKQMYDSNVFGDQSAHPFPSVVDLVEFPDPKASKTADTIKQENVLSNLQLTKVPDVEQPVKWMAQGLETDPTKDEGDGPVCSECDETPSDDEVDGVIEQVISAAKGLPELMKNFSMLTSTVVESVKSFDSSVQDLRTVVVKGVEKQTEAADAVISSAGVVASSASSFENLSTWAINGTRIVLFYKGIKDLIEAASWEERWVPIASCALALGLSPDIVLKAGEWLISSVSNIFSSTKGNEDVTAQSYEACWDESWTAFIENHADLFKFVSAGVITLITFYLTSGAPITNNVSSFAANSIRKLKNFAIVGSALKTLDWMWKWISETIKSALVWIGDTVTGGSVTSYRMSKNYPEVIEWLKAVEGYKQESMQVMLCWDAESRMDLWKRMDEGNALLDKLSVKQGNLYNVLAKGMLALQNVHDTAVVSRYIAPFREDPFHICLTGLPGVGKSAILTFMLNFIGDEVGLPKIHRFYPRGEEDDYWTRYTGQPIVVMDDLFSDKKSKALKELIKMKSNMAWPLNMADVKEKGRGFISKLVGSTTNVAYPAPPELTTKGALWRRRDVLLQVKRMGPQEAGKTVRWEDLRFDLLNSTTENSTPLKENMKLEDVLVMLAERYIHHSQTQKALVLAGLQGKYVNIPDYGECDWKDKDVPVSMNEVLKEFVNSGRKPDNEFMQAWLNQVSVSDFLALKEIPKVKELIEGFSCTANFEITRAREILAKEIWFIVGSENQTRFEVMFERAREMNLYKEMVVTEGVMKYVPTNLDQEEKPKWGILVKRESPSGVAVWDQFRAQGPHEIDLLIDGTGEEVLSRAQQLRTNALAKITTHKKMLEGMSELTAATMKGVKVKRVKIASDEEIKDFVTRVYAEFEDLDREELQKNVKEVFKWANEDATKLQNHLARCDNKDISRLFSPECDSYWEKDSKGDWHVKFKSETNSDDEFTLWTAAELMREKWTQKEINEMKDIAKVKPVPLSGWVSTVQKYMKGKYDAALQWFKEHPQVVRMFKMLGFAAVLFGSYKLLKYMCPQVIEKINLAMCGVFGWTVGKTIGQDRVDCIVDSGKRIVKAGTDRLSGWYQSVRSLMANSKDPAVREAANDERAVVMFAETMETQLGNSKAVLELRNAKVAEAKRSWVNPYFAGDGAKVVRPEAKTLAEAAKPVFVAHGSSDANATELRTHKLAHNMVRILRVTDKSCIGMSGVFLGGSDLLVPSHFWNGISEGELFTITTKTGISLMEVYQQERCVKLRDQDLSIYRCGIKHFGMFKELSQNFITQADVDQHYRVESTLNILSTDRSIIVHMVLADLDTEVSYVDKGLMIRNAVAWSYQAPTTNGDCGGILMADTTTMPRKLMGMHVCGAVGANYGASSIITQELIKEARQLLPEVTMIKATNIVPSSILVKPPEEMKIKPQGNFTHLGAVSPVMAVKLPHKTEIEKSAIHDMVREHVTEPAVLTANDPRNESGSSPLLRALEKYGVPTVPFDPVDLDYVKQDITAEVMKWNCPMPRRKLTDWEAVFGNETIDYCDRMNLSASPGYPYTIYRPSGEKGKAYLYDVNSEDGIKDENYRKAYRERELLAKQGVRAVSIWTDCLKDERRPLQKIREGKTRAFMLPPADFVQLCRKYFMAFCVCFYSNNVTSFSAVGMDPYSYDWTRLVRKLKKKSPYGFGGDFHSFDGIFDPDIMWRIGLMINQWYARQKHSDWLPEDEVVRQVLVHEMIHTVHICLDSIYMKHQGNPSGNPLTVIVNTFAHCYYIRLSYIALTRRMGMDVSLYNMHKSIGESYYGDDGLASVPVDTAEWFNLVTVSEYLKEHKIEYTSENKSGSLYGVKKITECTFLKNGMVQLPGTKLWLAPIAEDTIYELTNWVRKSEDPIAQLHENLENALGFAFHHGKEFYDRLLLKINAALEKRNLKEMSLTYEIAKRNFQTKCAF